MFIVHINSGTREERERLSPIYEDVFKYFFILKDPKHEKQTQTFEVNRWTGQE